MRSLPFLLPSLFLLYKSPLPFPLAPSICTSRHIPFQFFPSHFHFLPNPPYLLLLLLPCRMKTNCHQHLVFYLFGVSFTLSCWRFSSYSPSFSSAPLFFPIHLFFSLFTSLPFLHSFHLLILFASPSPPPPLPYAFTATTFSPVFSLSSTFSSSIFLL